MDTDSLVADELYVGVRLASGTLHQTNDLFKVCSCFCVHLTTCLATKLGDQFGDLRLIEMPIAKP